MLFNKFVMVCLLVTMLSRYDVVGLLFQQSSVLQLVGSLSLPIEIRPKDQQLFFDWGFQMNYNFPYNLSSVYNLPIWRNIDQFVKRDLPEGLYKESTSNKLYVGLQKLLLRYDFDSSCLLRSICELARHPFAESIEHPLSETLSYLLKPTLHKFFDSKATYESAELLGQRGAECSETYPDCEQDLLSSISRVVFF